MARPLEIGTIAAARPRSVSTRSFGASGFRSRWRRKAGQMSLILKQAAWVARFLQMVSENLFGPNKLQLSCEVQAGWI